MSFPPRGGWGGGDMGVGIRNYTKTCRVISLEGTGKARRYRTRFPTQRSQDASRRESAGLGLCGLPRPPPAGAKPYAPPGATHRPQCWPAGRSTGATAPTGAAAAKKSSLGQPRSRKAEERNMESKHGRRGKAGRLVLALVLLVRPVGITMQFARTNGRWEDLAAQLSFRRWNSLHFSPSRLERFIRLGRGASATQTEGMSVWRSSETGRKPRSYFPRSFTMSKK